MLIYRQSGVLLYRSILDNIGHLEKTKITTTFRCGLNKQVMARCTVDDDVMAIYCLLAKWGRSDLHAVTDIESYFATSPQHFTTGSPAKRVAFLSTMMGDVINMNIELKASQTMIPIYNILSDRHSLFTAGLMKYADGGSTPNDCERKFVVND